MRSLFVVFGAFFSFSHLLPTAAYAQRSWIPDPIAEGEREDETPKPDPSKKSPTNQPDKKTTPVRGTNLFAAVSSVGYQGTQILQKGRSIVSGISGDAAVRYMRDTPKKLNFISDLGIRSVWLKHTETSDGKNVKVTFNTYAAVAGLGMRLNLGRAQPTTRTQKLVRNLDFIAMANYDFGFFGRVNYEGRADLSAAKLEQQHRAGVLAQLLYEPVPQLKIGGSYSLFLGTFRFAPPQTTARLLYSGSFWAGTIGYVF